jgi:hypothetical protein
MTDLDLETIHLDDGAHDSPDDGMCVMEAASLVAKERWSDHPQCVSPVIASFLRAWNDALGDDDRQQLRRWIVPILNTASTPEVEDRRAWMALDWLVRVHTPAWLRLAGLDDQAARLADLPEFASGMDVPAIRPVIDAVRKDAAAARDAAGDAAGDAAWDAAWDAAGDAAWDAARAAAWDAAGDAAWDAARAAAWDAAWAAAGAAAWDAARAAAWDAAWDAARDAVRPTVVELQASAHDLIGRLVAAS